MSGTRGAGVLGSEPLDARISGGPPRLPRARHPTAVRLAAAPVPGLLLVVGLAIGPEGLNLLSARTMSYLDPAVSAALAAAGVLVGLGLDLRRRPERRLLGIASGEAAFAFVLVATAALAVLASVPPPGVTAWLAAAMIGICAAASSSPPAPDPALPDSDASRIADLDDVLPIALAAVALAVFREGSPPAASWFLLQCAALAAAVALAAALLLGRASDGEQHVHTAGLVLLLGGLAEFLGASALLQGLVAGLLLGALGGTARERLASDLRHVQHPLFVLLLLVAGAKVSFTPALFLVVLACFAVRSAAKLAAARLLRRRLGRRAGPDVARTLVSPGVMAPALALGFAQAGADPTGLVVGTAVVAAVFSELVAVLMRREAAE